jgi:hypothetical protein
VLKRTLRQAMVAAAALAAVSLEATGAALPAERAKASLD